MGEFSILCEKGEVKNCVRFYFSILRSCSSTGACSDMCIDGYAYDSLINRLPEDKILDWSKLKQNAGGIFECI